MGYWEGVNFNLFIGNDVFWCKRCQFFLNLRPCLCIITRPKNSFWIHGAKPYRYTQGRVRVGPPLRTWLLSTWSTALHQSQTFPADFIYGQPLDITRPYHVTGSALSVVGPSLSLVRRSGTRYRTVSATWRSPATASHNRWKRTYFVITTQHTQRSRDASWLCAV